MTMTNEATERILCMNCGKSVSSEVPKPTIVRAWVECPECIEAGAASPSAVLTEHSAFMEVHFLVMHREKEYRDAGNHKRANEIAEVWNQWIKALEFLSAPAQPTRRDRIDNVTRDTPGEGKL